VVDSITQGDTIESVTIQGNAGALFKKIKPRLDEWNKTLNKNFPKLPKA
jgi:peptidyl-prolyl cis-trans isomerase B (cyclophilin B)